MAQRVYKTPEEQYKAMKGRSDFERYAKLKDFYKVLEDEVDGEKVHVVIDKYGNDVGSYHPDSDEFIADDYYDEVEPHNDTKDVYTKRMTALGYSPEQIAGVIKDYKL